MVATIKLLIVEDNPSDFELTVTALSASEKASFEILAATSIQSALTILAGQDVDAVLLDLNLPDAHGLNSVRAILDSKTDVPIVVLTGADDEQLGLEAVAIGAQDYLVKGTISDAAIRRAVQFAIQRLDRELTTDLYNASELDQSVAQRIELLTPRERETLNLLVLGISLKHLASRLEISVQTAAKHRTRVLQKMRVENDVELVRLILGR